MIVRLIGGDIELIQERRPGQASEGQQPFGGGLNQRDQRPPEVAHTPPDADIEIVDVARLEAERRERRRAFQRERQRHRYHALKQAAQAGDEEAQEELERRRAQKRAAERRFRQKLKTNPEAITPRVPSPEGIVERYKGYQRKADHTYTRKPEVRERQSIRSRAYRQRPEVRERERARDRARRQRPDVRERKRARQRERYRQDPEMRERRKANWRDRDRTDAEFRAKESARKRAWYQRKKTEQAAFHAPGSNHTEPGDERHPERR